MSFGDQFVSVFNSNANMDVGTCNHLVSDPICYCESCNEVLCKRCIRAHPENHDSSTVTIEEYMRKEAAHFQKELEHIIHFKKEIDRLDTRSNDLQKLVDAVRQRCIDSTQSFDHVKEKLVHWKDKTVKNLKEMKEEESRLAAEQPDSESGCFQKPLVLHRGSISIANTSRKLAPTFIAERLTARFNSQPTVVLNRVQLHSDPCLTTSHSCPSPEIIQYYSDSQGGDQYYDYAAWNIGPNEQQLLSDEKQTANNENVEKQSLYSFSTTVEEEIYEDIQVKSIKADPTPTIFQKDDDDQQTNIYSNILISQQNIQCPAVQQNPLMNNPPPVPAVPQRNRKPSTPSNSGKVHDNELSDKQDLPHCSPSPRLMDGFQQIDGAATGTEESPYIMPYEVSSNRGKKIPNLAANISYGLAVMNTNVSDREPIYDVVGDATDSGTSIQGSVTLSQQAQCLEQRFEEQRSSTHLCTEQEQSILCPLHLPRSHFLPPIKYTVISNTFTEGVTFNDICTNSDGYIIAANLVKSCLEIFDSSSNYCGKIHVNGSPTAVAFREAHSKSNDSSILIAGDFRNCSMLNMKITEKFQGRTKNLKFLSGVLPLAIAVSNHCIKAKSSQSCFYVATRQVKSGMTNTGIKCLKCNGSSNSTLSSDGIIGKNPVAMAYQDYGCLIICDGEEGRLIKIYTDNGKPVWDEDVDARRRGIMKKPRGIAILPRGHIAVSDSEAHTVNIFTEDGALKQVIGKEGGNVGEFRKPTALAVRNFNELVVVDSLNYRLQILNMDHLFNTEKGDANTLEKYDEESMYSEVCLTEL